MKEHRRREAKRINSIQDPAVAFDEVAEVFYAGVSLDRGHDDATEETQDRDHQ
jgi:hypothetical protein